MIDKSLKNSLLRMKSLFPNESSVADESKVRETLVEYLKSNEMEGIENDSIADLVEFAEAFYDPEQEEGDDSFEQTQKEDISKPAKKTSIPEPTEEELEELANETNKPTRKELEKRTVAGVREFAVKNKYVSRAKANVMQKAELLALMFPEETPKQATAKTTIAKQKIQETIKTTNAALRKKAGGTETFDARNNEEHEAIMMNFLKEIGIEGDDFEIKPLKQGFTVRMALENTKPTLLNFDELKVQEGVLFGNCYFNKMKSVEELLKLLPAKYREYKIGMFRSETHPSIRGVYQQDVTVMFGKGSKIRETSEQRCFDEESAMAKNRANLEKQMELTK